MNKVKLSIFVILMLCVAPLLGQEKYGSWEIKKRETNGLLSYKAFSKAQNSEVNLIIGCAPNADPRDTFVIFLLQEMPFETIEKSTIRMTAVFDTDEPININWHYNTNTLLMFDSQWFAEKMKFYNSLTLHFRDLYGKKELNFSLENFDKTVSKLEEYCGYKFNAIPE